MRTVLLLTALALLAGCMDVLGSPGPQTGTAQPEAALPPPVTTAENAPENAAKGTTARIAEVPVPQPKPVSAPAVVPASQSPAPSLATASSATEAPADCYTVDLFTPERVRKPAKGVPAEFRAFLGRWAGGAWNDVWCHELLIYNVHKDGRVELVEMHAPYPRWNQPATAFNRVGRIDKDGVLRFSQGVETTAYRIEDGRVVGTRSGLYGNLKIVLFKETGRRRSS